jgi:mRNA-degrading endonuclease toxin of MazEF toxin-antitoxin module
VTIPEPRAGAVVRYSFLWSAEAEAGAQEGRKDRPVAVVIAIQRDDSGEVMVIVAPITRTPPADPTAAVELPPAVARRIGLDDSRHWIVCDEVNRFAWPGFDLRPIPGRSGAFEYGMLPEPVYRQMKAIITARYRARRLKTTSRD